MLPRPPADRRPPELVIVVEVPPPLPLPGQLQRVEPSRSTPEPTDPAARVNQANAAARIQPVRNGFINSIQVSPFTQGALYQVYTAVGQITDIALKPKRLAPFNRRHACDKSDIKVSLDDANDVAFRGAFLELYVDVFMARHIMLDDLR
jgi:hypothetical protein